MALHDPIELILTSVSSLLFYWALKWLLYLGVMKRKTYLHIFNDTKDARLGVFNTAGP